MAGLADFCNKIAAGFNPCGKTPSSAGIEPGIYVYNVADVVLTFDATNPLIVTGITGDLFKIKGFGDNFNSISKPAKKQVGGRYTETVTAYITENSVATKKFVYNALNGRVGVIVVNNDKSTESAVELFGAVNGLQLSENSQRDAANEDMQGAWMLEFTNPPKLTEPYPPRAVSIPPTTGPATYASTIAALEDLLPA